MSAREKNVFKPDLYTEKYRPQIHFSPARNWINDPNGLVWHKGRYHLFYQHNPTGNEWGNMHWGHAVSGDLIHWEEWPVALHADPWSHGYVFSGSAVVDTDNRSGLGSQSEAALVSLYTGCSTDGVQSQCLAFSLDDGRSWRQYPSNPVIENPGVRDFRDPKVFWHEQSTHWVMTLAADDHVEIYTSGDLINWTHASRFKKPTGWRIGAWECPDLFPLADEKGEIKWVLIVSVTPEPSELNESVQYFIGDFDGTTFKALHNEEMWLDYGADIYGAVTWDGILGDDGRRILIGWMSHWRYAKEMPTYPWRGNMTIPREISLVTGKRGLELAFLPVREIESIRTKSSRIIRTPIGDKRIQEVSAVLSPELLDIELEFSWQDAKTSSFGIQFTNESGEKVTITADVSARTLALDRSRVGLRVPNLKMADKFEAPLRNLKGSLKLRVIKDRASIELFGDEGRSVISANLFYDSPFGSAEVFGDGDVDISGQVSVLKSIWSSSNWE